MTLLTCPSCHTSGHIVLYGETPRCQRCITRAADARLPSPRMVPLPAARVEQLERLSAMQVKRCSRCLHQTFARKAYASICRGEHGPKRHPPQIMQAVIIGRHQTYGETPDLSRG